MISVTETLQALYRRAGPRTNDLLNWFDNSDNMDKLNRELARLALFNNRNFCEPTKNQMIETKKFEDILSQPKHT